MSFSTIYLIEKEVLKVRHPPPPPPTALAVIVIASLFEGRRGEGREGRGNILEEVTKDDIYLKFGNLNSSDIFFGQTDRPTLWFVGKLHFQKNILGLQTRV